MATNEFKAWIVTLVSDFGATFSSYLIMILEYMSSKKCPNKNCQCKSQQKNL